jgi:hypothetical protein
VDAVGVPLTSPFYIFTSAFIFWPVRSPPGAFTWSVRSSAFPQPICAFSFLFNDYPTEFPVHEIAVDHYLSLSSRMEVDAIVKDGSKSVG